MKKLITYFLLSNMFFSCNPVKKIVIPGSYESSEKDYIYSLTLSSTGNSFLLSKKYFEVNSFCQGIWTAKKDTITLKCNEEEFPAQITGGYMSQRESKVQILNKDELKLDHTILKRVKKNY